MGHHDVIILGAGFSGLGMAIALKRAGRTSFVLLEKAGEVGGTWRENRYPGCACDVSSHLYSFSFEPNPNWSRLYSTQPEILDYLKRTADKYGLRPFIRFNETVEQLRWDEGAGHWRIQTGAGHVYTARVVVSGMGGLHIPGFPAISGRERFAGPAFHSAEWREDVDLRGKAVAVIGTGASAIQIVPEIAPVVKQLQLYQRTPPWVLPKLDRPMKPWEKALFAKLPLAQRLLRGWIYSRNESLALGFLKVGERDIAGDMGRRFIEAQVEDPALRAKLTPDYRLGCKRVLISNDYYPALARDNVELVTDGISAIDTDAIVTADGARRPADVIIYCTGFKLFELPVRIIGRGGRVLNDAWRENPQAYLGITMSGYPNLFLLMGPNTGLGHNSMIYMIESQIHYVLDALRRMDACGTRVVDAKAAVQSSFNEGLNRRLARSVWKSGCTSWYQNEKGQNATIWPGFTFAYRRRTRRADLDDFEQA